MIEDIRYKKVNWPVLLLFIVLMILMLFYFDNAIAQEGDQAKAVAQKTMSAMGGLENWKKVAAIRFDFRVEREGSEPRFVKHLWDRAGNRDHVEGQKEGKNVVAWVNLHNKSGVAWIDGKKAEGEEVKNMLEWAYARWVNDTYWLIMPLKLLDPGVQLKFDGKKEGYDVLHVSFQKVGLTPGDQYWAYINKQTGLMDRWDFLLQGEKEKATFFWTDWKQHGNTKLSSLKENKESKTRIRFDPLQILDSADPKYFGSEAAQLQN